MAAETKRLTAEQKLVAFLKDKGLDLLRLRS